ncbi:hypothetical protein C1H46_019620 [Malus baccata]|uniref:Transcriptional regulator SLK2 n=1 Tax=Malus baccata TaxID=106549 RepID=A0A540M7S6_MALBA|nr:hypothetical protein C1H46_019620 [Malus baccata]
MQFQGRNPQLQAMLQQQRAHLQQQQQQQQQQLRQQQFQQPMQPVSSIKRPYDGGVCARRLMQYLHHQRQRPADNSIAYWRKFVTEYYSPRAKKRWCLSFYDNVGYHARGVFPLATMDAWQCDICGSKSGRSFEATFEVLPRLNEIKFGSGVIDELLHLDLPCECRFPSGVMMLEYGKAVQESVYEQLRVVREGQLRIIFTQDLKILSWEFCERRHEELPRRLVAPQVNQLVQVAQKCQSTIAESGSDGISQQDLQTNSNMVPTAGRQLAKSLELQSLHYSGFSKRYVRCLQISEVVNSMMDLFDFCRENKVGLIEGLKVYPRHATAAKLQMQKMQDMEQLASAQEMSNNSGGGQQSLPCPSANGSVGRNGVSFGGNNPAAAPSTSNVSGSHGPAPSRNNSFKVTANSDNSTGGGGNNTYNQRAPDLRSNLYLQEDLLISKSKKKPWERARQVGGRELGELERELSTSWRI